MNQKEMSAYVAGLIDGEGYVSLVPVRNKTQEKKDFYLVPVVKMSSTFFPIMDFMKKNYKGHIDQPRFVNTNWKPAKSWTVRNRKDVYAFLTDIYKYLRIKKQQAKLVIDFIEMIETDKNKRGLQNKIPQSKRNEIYKQIRKLNKRGVATTE